MSDNDHNANDDGNAGGGGGTSGGAGPTEYIKLKVVGQDSNEVHRIYDY